MKTLAAEENVVTAAAARAEPAVPNAWAAALAAAATGGLLYAGSCKLALFADLAYTGSDWSSVLQMSKSFRYTGVPLYDNIYGYGAAIHNNYLLLLFFPLTYPLGAYGLILGLLALHALAVFRLLRTSVLSFWSRLAVLAAVLSPVSFWTLDDATWGFHVELCNLPLGVLFTLALLERRWRAAALSALALSLVKEDGAILVAAILLAYFLARLVREGPTRRLLRGAAISLTACLLIFLAGLALQHLVARSLPTPQLTGDVRILRALRVVARALGGRGTRGDWSEGISRALGGWALLAVTCGLPLLRRLPVHLLLFAAGSVALVPALVVSSAAYYGFAVVWWAPRMATVLTLATACVAITAALFRPCSWPGAERRALLAASLAAIAAGWLGWGALLAWRADYDVLERANLLAALSGRGQPIERLHEEELRFARCLARELPRDFPLETVGPQSPVFHHQALVFSPGEQNHPSQTPRLVVVMAGNGDPPASPLARVCRLFVTGDPQFVPLLRRCGAQIADAPVTSP